MMFTLKPSTPQKLAITSSVIITIFTGILMVIAHFLGWMIWLMIFVPVIFLISYFSTLYILAVLINDKITPIYKTIREVPIEGKKMTKLIGGKRDIIADVDHEVKLWADLKLAEIDRLRELEKYRKDFVGNVSHELKTPIFNIQGYILTLLDGGLEDPNINRLYLERTEKSIDRMISIVEDLESITKLESGELKLNIESFDLVKLTEEVFDLELRDANSKRISMNSGFLPEERAWLTNLFEKVGYVDVYRKLEPKTTDSCYTWWSNRGQAYAKNVGWRIDYHISTPGIGNTAKKTAVYKDERFSDHAPLTVDYDWKMQS